MASTNTNFSNQSPVSELSSALGYSFSQPSLLEEALTHSSYLKESGIRENIRCNERLEFLGDAVLGLVISTALLARPERFDEGHLSKIRASLVNENTLAEVAQKLRLGAYLKLGRGEEKSRGREKRSLLADCFEAIVGAIYLDGGLEAVQKVVLRLFSSFLDESLHERVSKDYKTTLQELTQSHLKQIPSYRVIGQEGPDHDKRFEVEVALASEVLGRGRGLSKKRASQEAALSALRYLEQNPGVWQRMKEVTI